MPPTTFDPVPSATRVPSVVVQVEATESGPAAVHGVPVRADQDAPPMLGLSREQLATWGFAAEPGQTFVLPRGEDTLVAVGLGTAPTLAEVRDAAAAFARAAAREPVLTLTVPDVGGAQQAAQAAVEGALLARYRYDVLRSPDPGRGVDLTRLVLRVPAEQVEQAGNGAARGHVLARAAAISRDLATTPGGHLNAPDLAAVAERLAAGAGLDVQVYDKAACEEMGLGGLLGVNAGSVHEPRMIRLDYQPSGGSEGHLGLVGKGITYDSGGISLKPSNAMHAAMKMDMTGAGAILAAMSVLHELGVPVRVTAYLACTDNMPSGSATKLGDVLTTRSGRSIEVMNTDAEGRLVMADAIALANEDGVDAIIDIATLTGAALMALGPQTAALFGTDETLRSLVEDAAASTDERVWRMPLDRRYRKWLDSEVADIKNLGGESAGAIIAALFLAEWVGQTPWAHLDIAGPMLAEADEAWRTKGATGFGARLLVAAAEGFAVR